MVHVDVADGHFAPNISMGPDTVRSIRAITRLPLDTHLMISEPEKFIDPFLKAGSDIVTIHGEVVSSDQFSKMSKLIRSKDKRAGLALKPLTPLPAWFEEQVRNIDLLLVLSVNPGFPGQKFMPEVLPKVQAAARVSRSSPFDIEVDGGVDHDNAQRIVQAGATILVAGASIFRKEDVKSALRSLRDIANRGVQEVHTKC